MVTLHGYIVTRLHRYTVTSLRRVERSPKSEARKSAIATRKSAPRFRNSVLGFLSDFGRAFGFRIWAARTGWVVFLPLPSRAVFCSLARSLPGLVRFVSDSLP